MLAAGLALGAAGCTRAGFGERRAASADGSASTADAGPRDGAILPGFDLGDSGSFGANDITFSDAPWKDFRLFLFKLFWATPGTLSLLWQCDGRVPDFDRYELCYSTDPTVPAGNRRCLTPLDDLALGDGACGGGTLWHPTTIYGLEPSTTYYLLLSVYDKSGVRYDAPIQSHATTAKVSGSRGLFEEQIPKGVWLLELKHANTRPHTGTWHLSARPTSAGWLNLHYGGIGPVSLGDGVDAKRFASAYLEFYVDVPAPLTLCIDLVGSGDVASYCQPRGFATVDGRPGYQRIQVPLREFHWRDGSRLDLATFGRWTKLQIGGTLPVGEIVIDDISLRY